MRLHVLALDGVFDLGLSAVLDAFQSVVLELMPGRPGDLARRAIESGWGHRTRAE